MRVKNYFNFINEKKGIRPSDVRELKKYNLAMSRAYLVRMYDMSYINDPTIFDEKQIRLNIVDLGIKGMFNLNGIIQLTSRQVSYALLKNKGNAEALEFLKLLLNVLVYRERSKAIDRFYDSCNFVGEKKKQISLGLYRSGSEIKSGSGTPFNEGVYECFCSSGYSVVKYTDRTKIFELAMEILGIDYTGEIGGLLDSDLTLEEEIDFCDLLLDGEVPLTGKYKDTLVEWLQSNKWSILSNYYSKKCGLYSYIMKTQTEIACDIQSDLLGTVIDELGISDESDSKIVSISTDSIYVTEKNLYRKMPISAFSVQCGEEDIVSDPRNILDGYVGEAYSVDYLEKESILYVGCPIELYTSAVEKELYVDLEQVKFDTYGTWFKVNRVDLDFDGIGIANNFKEGSLELILFNMYLDAEEGNNIGILDNTYTDKQIEIAKSKVSKYIRGFW